MNQKVSIIIASWNAGDTLPACIRSVAAQTYPYIEIIVVDDCSTDNTASVVQALQQEISQLRYLHTPQNAGPSAARNLGINAATGEWIAILDSDDWYKPERIARLVAHAKKNKADIVFDDILLCKPPAEGNHEHEPISRLIDTYATKLDWNIANYAMQNRPYENQFITGFLKPIIRKSFLDQHHLRYNEALRNSEDYILILTSLIHGANISYLNEAFYVYVVNNNSLSGKFNKERHMRLIEAETALMEQYKLQLDSQAIYGINAHIQSLRQALVTNLIFEHIRHKNFALSVKLLCSHPMMLHKNINRIIISLCRKLNNTASRGR